MSSIASFYLVKIEQIAVLKDLAGQPVGPIKNKFLGITFDTGKWRDPFYDFLQTEAQELGEFHESGSIIFTEVFEFLESRSLKIVDFADEELSNYLATTRNGSCWVFKFENAHSLAKSIETIENSSQMVCEFLEHSDTETLTFDGSLSINEAAELVSKGITVVKNWLLQVNQETIGLLSIG